VVAYLLSTQGKAEVAKNVSHALLLCGIRKKGSHQSMRGRTELNIADPIKKVVVIGVSLSPISFVNGKIESIWQL